MNTLGTNGTGTDRPKRTAILELTMLALAGTFLVTIGLAASILITLPEALETVATPAFGAPWITAPEPKDRDDRRPPSSTGK